MLTEKHLLSNKHGFTIIEVLIVFTIIGILTAIAIPQFFSYRMRAIDTQMKNDLKNVALGMESYYSERFVYPSSVAEILPFGFRQTQGVNLTINLVPPTDYTVTASKPGGTRPNYTYDSMTGLMY